MTKNHSSRAAPAFMPRRALFFNLFLIRQPVTAIVSFLHRVSGVILVLATPWLIYLLQAAAGGRAGYESVAQLWASPGKRALIVIIALAFIHHLLAGCRHLLFDMDVATSLRGSRRSAKLVVAGVAIALILLLVRAL